MKLRVALYCVLMLSAAMFASRAADKPQGPQAKGEKAPEHKPMSFWMKKKLEYSENVIEALATGDFDKLAENARSMTQLNAIEEFVRGRDETYRHELHAFEHASRQLLQQAEKENIEGATLAYMELTLSCVNCHKHLRDHKAAQP